MNLADRLRTALDQGMQRPVPIIEHDGKLFGTIDTHVPAAVLVAITNRAEPGVILTQRLQSMRKHPGQVAFPGGRMDESDADIVAAALREAHEEIALPPSTIEIVGLADPYRTITGFVVTPVLAVAPADLDLQPNPDEVDTIFEVPLSFLLDRANHKTQTVDWDGLDRKYYEMHWGKHRIWGATAAMIVNLSRRLDGLF